MSILTKISTGIQRFKNFISGFFPKKKAELPVIREKTLSDEIKASREEYLRLEEKRKRQSIKVNTTFKNLPQRTLDFQKTESKTQPIITDQNKSEYPADKADIKEVPESSTKTEDGQLKTRSVIEKIENLQEKIPKIQNDIDKLRNAMDELETKVEKFVSKTNVELHLQQKIKHMPLDRELILIDSEAEKSHIKHIRKKAAKRIAPILATHQELNEKRWKQSKEHEKTLANMNEQHKRRLEQMEVDVRIRFERKMEQRNQLDHLRRLDNRRRRAEAEQAAGTIRMRN